jgi:hypothetical protein
MPPLDQDLYTSLLPIPQTLPSLDDPILEQAIFSSPSDCINRFFHRERLEFVGDRELRVIISRVGYIHLLSTAKQVPGSVQHLQS